MELEITGQTFGRLTVLEKVQSRGKNNITMWLCKCECGGTTITQGRSLKSGNTKSCGCARSIATYWTGHGEISGGYWKTVQHNADLRNILFEVKIEDAWNLFLKQNRMCAISGDELIFTRNYVKKKGLQTASLDRIDSSLHYTLLNVQWVHKTINIMKNSLQDDEFFKWCSKVHKFKTNPVAFKQIQPLFSQGDKVIHTSNGRVYYYGYMDSLNRAVVYSTKEINRKNAFVLEIQDIKLVE